MRIRVTAAIACAVLCLSGCAPTTLDGRATSMLFNPERVGGLPVGEGPSGPRPDAPPPVGTVENSDGGPIDRLVLLALNDIQEFWQENYDKYFSGGFAPIDTFVSYDSTDPDGPSVCDIETYGLAGAFFCIADELIAWDSVRAMPVAAEFFGEMGVVGVIAHEYGHALQRMAGLIAEGTPVLVAEQQADCFAGVYLRSVAAGQSPRFVLSTGEGLNRVLAGVIYLRDPLITGVALDPHGSALDRISAFQMGFTGSADQCAGIDVDEIAKRQGDLPQHMTFDEYGEPVLDSTIDEATVETLMTVLTGIFRPSEAPTLSTDPAGCGVPAEPASYCPADNTIHVDMPALQVAGEPKNEEEDQVLVQGDNTALSMVTSRYALAVQQKRGVALDTPVAALRTACLTGVAQGQMTQESGTDFVLSPGDADEAVAGLLTNGVVASDVNGRPAPAGFTRILAYRLGLSSDVDQCFERFAES